MNDQDLGQGGATQSTQTSTPPKDGASVDLLGDATAAAIKNANAIHDAFLMGWSLQELKSRVLLGTFGLQPSAPTRDSTPETVQASAGSVTKTPHLPFSIVDTLLQAVLPPASPVTAQRQGMPSNLNKSIARMSEWRAIFIRIATVHDQCFPASTTTSTPYDPSPTLPPKSRFPYLYPSTPPNYALIGINGSGSMGVGDLDERLGKFQLYDVTRRALNCLALLYTRPEESLLPEIICDCQTQIVQSILNHTQAPGTATPAPQDVPDQESAAQEGLNQEVTEVLRAYLNEASAGPSQDALNAAIKVLSFLTVRFLDSWDGYLRENFYVGGRLKNNELELLAYEAGRSLSSLSWGISLMTVQLENDLGQKLDSAQLLTRLSTTWTNVFQSASINAVQRQISALGPALDDAYYVLKKVQRPTAGERPSPDLPSRAIHALTYSLVYWQRAVEWICQRPPSGTAVSTTTTAAAIETTTTSASVSTPPVNTAVSTTTTAAVVEATTTSASVDASTSDGAAKPLALSLALSRQLRQALVTQAGIWQSLMLGEQTLQSFTTESVTKRILKDIMVELESTVSKIVVDSSKDALKRFRVPIIVGGGFCSYKYRFFGKEG